MRSYFTLGLISLVGAAAVFACGDDDSDSGNTAGTGGTAGAGGGGAGTAGTGGGAGNAGQGGTAGTAGTAGTGGSGNVPIPAANCTGCVQLSLPIAATPFATTGTQVGYIFSAPATGAPFDLSEVTSITWKVQALTPDALYYVQPFLQTAPPEDPTYAFGSFQANVPLTPATFTAGTWVDVTVNIAALPGGSVGDAGADAAVVVTVDAGDAGGGTTILTAFDKSKTRSIGLNIGAGPTAGAGVVSVEVDSVTVVGTSNFTTKNFDANVEGLTINNYLNVPGAVAPGFH